MEATKPETPVEEEKKLNIVDEARLIRDEIRKEKEELRAEREALEKAKSEDILGGSTEGAVPKEAPKEQTPQEYVEAVMAGKVGEAKVD